MSSLIFEALWRDRGASAGLKGLGRDADAAAGKFGKMSTATKIGLVAAGAAVLKFGVSSVKAYSDAQTSQAKLAFAFQKFPKLADTNQAALQKLNGALQLKTKFDDDAIASGQAVLAQYDLTGKQLTEVTPLLLDYAAKTGKDLPAAASAMGKAFLGNTRALKEIGINYKSTGNQAQDFANITGLMRQQVGGFAEAEGKTAAGQLAILKNQFGELQETVGAQLVPALVKVTSGAIAAMKAFNGLPDGVKQTAVVAGALAAAAILGVGAVSKLAVAAAETSAALKVLGVSASGARAKLAGLNGGGLLAVAGFVAVQAASAALDGQLDKNSAGIDGYKVSLSSLGKSSAQLDSQLKTFGSSFGLFGQGIGDTRTAMKALADTQNPVSQGFRKIGDAMGMSSTAGILANEFDKIDKSLTQMDPAAAAAAFKKLSDEGRAVGMTTEQINATFDDYLKSLQNVPPAAGAAAGSTGQLTGALKKQAPTVQEVTDKLYANANAALALSGSQIGVESAIDAARSSLKDYRKALIDKAEADGMGEAAAKKHADRVIASGKALDINTEAGRNNRQALNGIASATLQYTKSLVDAKKPASEVAAANERGRSSFIKTARAMGASKKEATNLANSLFKLPKQVTSKVVVAGSKVSVKEAKDLNAALKGIPKNQRARIVTIANTKGAKAAQAEIKKVKDKNARIKFETNAKKKREEANKESQNVRNRERRITLQTNAKKKREEADRETNKAKNRQRRIDVDTNARKTRELANREVNKAHDGHAKIDVGTNASAARRSAQSSMNAVHNVTRTIHIRTIKANAFGGKMGFADGGSPRMRGLINAGSFAPRADDVDARLSRGEWVIQEPSARRYGDAAMSAVNAGTARIEFARGGSPGGRADYVSAGSRGGAVHNHYYTINAPNYVGPEKELVKALTVLKRRNQLAGVLS